MSTDRDQLANLLKAAGDRESLAQHNLRYWGSVAEAVVAAGWRPLARRIETTLEVDALPDGTVIRDDEGCVFEVAVRERGVVFWATRPWTGFGNDFGYGASSVSLPAVVLWSPEVTA